MRDSDKAIYMTCQINRLFVSRYKMGSWVITHLPSEARHGPQEAAKGGQESLSMFE